MGLTRSNLYVIMRLHPVRTVTVLALIVFAGCSSSPASAQTFTLSSPDMESGGAMPVAFTCDGESQSPSLTWTPGPEGTVEYAIAMHHSPGPGDTHWYWVVYNIPPATYSIPVGGPAPGTLGTNSVNSELAYALSAAPTFPTDTQVSRDVLLDAISSTTLSSASFDVSYERS
jgi:phosphatidylethanolamine-binding protein (PEBP) family uncharacterized protein